MLTLLPIGPPEDPEAILSGTLNVDGITLTVTAIAATTTERAITVHPNSTRTLNDLYQLGVPRATYTANNRHYILYALSE